ncbi:MAG: transposase [Thermoanaerobaculia bacterium]|nr:transposase [Thermoanaerobaculia bacterium]
MARPIRLEYPGAVWHVTVRGNEKRPIFLDDVDRARFLEIFARTIQRFDWIVTAYVLMSNHYHLVVELTSSNLSRGMHLLNTSYSQAFNRRHDRVGHLFQGRFKAFLIDKENYMLEVLRYVVLNPVRAGMVSSPEKYEWSSYRATVGDSHAAPWLAAEDVLALFGEERRFAQGRYRAFVREGIGARSPWNDLVGQIYLGDEAWIGRVRERVEARPRPDAHAMLQRNVGKPMTDVVSSVARALVIDEYWLRAGRGGTARMIAAWLGCHEGQLPLASIAAGLRLRSAGHVSTLITRCDRQLSTDETLRRSFERCRETLYRVWRTSETKT